MKCYHVILRRNKFMYISSLYLILFLSNVVTNVSSQGLGVPLPILRENQGQQNTQDKNINFNVPFTVKLDDQNEGFKAVPSSDNSRGASFRSPMPQRGAGSLLHIQDPYLDESVLSLINHPAVLKKIQKETSSDSAVKVDSVITAHKQVVSGLIIYLDLKVVETNCSVGTPNAEECEVDVKEDPYICEVAVWQRPWLNSTKIVDEKTRCAEVESDTDFKNWNKGHEILRHTENEVILKQLPEYLDEYQVALEAFDYINRGSDSKFKGQMAQYHIGDIMHNPVSNSTTMDVKVEYGFTLCLKFPNRKVDDRICPVDLERDNYVCKVTVVSDPNLTTNLKVDPGNDDDIECEKKEAVEEELVVPVKAVCMGCPQPVSLNDPSILRVAEFAVIEYDRNSDERELHSIRRLHKAHTQVVNGIKYFLTLELGETDCRKPLSAVNMNRSLCNEDFTEEPEICEVVVLEQPWQKSSELVSSRCFDKSEYASISRDEFIVPVVGGSLQAPSASLSPSPSVVGADHNGPHSETEVIDLESNLWKKSIDFVVQEFNRREVDDSDDGFYKIINILDASTTNDLEGDVDHLVIELGETICTRRRVMEECPLKLDDDTEICEASVLRGDPDQLLSLRCDEKDDDDIYIRAKNPFVTPYQPLHEPFFVADMLLLGAPGAPIEQPTNESSITDVAQFVVHQYNLQSDEDELYKLSRIIRSYSQIASNVIYTLELELRETQCKKYQPVDDVSKCPLEPKEESEVCQAEVSASIDDNGVEHKKLTRIFCDDRKDYYVKMLKHLSQVNTHAPGQWKPEETETDKMRELGELIADEFDFRSDEDNIFVFSKILDAKTEETGLTHRLKVELAETVCPKYKQTINKTRCAIDIGEDLKICDAVITEQPWKGQEKVVKLSCFERDDSLEEDESKEVLYPNVHPSAHARPKFIQSRFRSRFGSHESDESNEKYYYPRVSRMRHDIDSDEDGDHDDDDRFTVSRRAPNIQPFGRLQNRNHKTVEVDDDDRYDNDFDDKASDDDDRNIRDRYRANRRNKSKALRVVDDDDDEDDDDDRNDNDNDDDDDSVSNRRQERDSRSFEHHSFSRTRRAVKDKSDPKPSLLGGFTEVDANDTKVKELSTYALAHMDSLADDQHLRRVEQVLEAHRKVVAGLLWTIKSKVVYTSCTKETQNSTDLTECETDTSKPTYICHIEIYERPWENYRTVQESRCETESPSANRKRRSAAETNSKTGSATPVDVNDPDVQKLSAFALDHLDGLSEDPNLRRVDEVLEASRQIVSGYLWSLKIRLVPTLCIKDSASSADVSACELDSSKSSSVCDVKIWEQPWRNSKTVKEAHCEPETPASNRKRRSTVGSATPVDVNDPDVQKLSTFALDHLDGLSEDPNLRKVDEVLEASRQIVSGYLWSLKIRLVPTLCAKDSGSSADVSTCEVDSSKSSSVCNVKIWEQPWKNSKTVKEAHCEPETPASNRKRRSMVGSATPVDVNDPDVQKLSTFALDHLDGLSEDPNLRKVDEVLEASRQIVSGSLWSLKIRVVPTLCAKDSGRSADVSTCEVDSNKSSSVCNVKIWEQPWRNSKIVKEAHCEPETSASNRKRRSMVGSATPVDVNDPDIQKLSTFALDHMDGLAEDPNLRKVDEVLEASSQVVAGVLYSLKIRVVSTLCPKVSESQQDLSSCEVDSNKPTFICDVKIWEKPWMNFQSVTESNCSNEEPRTK